MPTGRSEACKMLLIHQLLTMGAECCTPVSLQHVGGLRSEKLEPALLRLLGDPVRFEELKAEWRAADRPVPAPRGLADALSKTVRG